MNAVRYVNTIILWQHHFAIVFPVLICVLYMSVRRRGNIELGRDLSARQLTIDIYLLYIKKRDRSRGFLLVACLVRSSLSEESL